MGPTAGTGTCILPVYSQNPYGRCVVASLTLVGAITSVLSTLPVDLMVSPVDSSSKP